MALFSAKRGAGREADTMDVTRAVVTPALLAIGADHTPDRERMGLLAEIVSFSPLFAGGDTGGVLKLLESVAADLRKRGPNIVMNEAVAALERPLRETAMAFALRILMDDGALGEDEQHLMMAISRQLDLPDELTDTIYSVLAILQRAAPG
ncbi:MAG: hypothetical protein MUE98_03275 [Rhodobacteraceae bacterium]|jgi:hypothetical protein|nr:hypothetical protein [Paracoccaceae bacterium]